MVSEHKAFDVSRLADGEWRQVITPQAPIRAAASPDAPLETEALKGEKFSVYEEDGEGWCRGQLVNDGYPGWIPAAALGAIGPAPTHRVSALRTLVFPGPSIKLPPVESPPLGGVVTVIKMNADLAEIAGGGFIPVRHLAPIDSVESDFVAVAERFVGTPYLWGGKTNAGIDCSGVVQIAMTACGKVCPRNSGDQEKSFGASVGPAGDLSGLQRGDLLFWPGHVAIVRGENSMIHANAFHMAVAIEPVTEGVARIAAAGSALRSIGRLRV